jgi:hypothetical protein
MTDCKYVDIAEWQALGGLQEANRLFFHPHGWALEITSVREPLEADGKLVQQLVEILRDDVRIGALIQLAAGGDLGAAELSTRIEKLAVGIGRSLYPVGTKYLSGIWDSSGDNEGIMFGSWTDQDRAKVKAVEARRSEFREARRKLFYGGRVEPLGTEDVEPTDYEWTDLEAA